jgi:hypothetical protein
MMSQKFSYLKILILTPQTILTILCVKVLPEFEAIVVFSVSAFTPGLGL